MSKQKIYELKEKGLSNREIAKQLDVSTQYVWSTLNGYHERYSKTDKYRAYKRRYYHETKNKEGEQDDRETE